eukprot:g76678.t1
MLILFSTAAAVFANRILTCHWSQYKPTEPRSECREADSRRDSSLTCCPSRLTPEFLKWPGDSELGSV